MKLTILWLFSVCGAMGQNDPFKELPAPSPESQEAAYDFDDIHKWDDVIVKGIGDEENILTWEPTNVASHKGVTGKCQVFHFSVDAKMYSTALGHPDSNRGVILMAGDPKFPLLHCWLRPISTHGDKQIFSLSVPVDRVGEMYVAFIPNEGKKRYLYKLDHVALRLKEIEVEKSK